MILFDYGQTLVDEIENDVDRGLSALLDLAVENPNRVSVEELRMLYDRIDENIFPSWRPGEKNPDTEVPRKMIHNYLFDYFGIKLAEVPEMSDFIYASNAYRLQPTGYIGELMNFLKEMKIRAAVISNLSFRGATLRKLIDATIPENNMEFVVTSSDYIFKKPHPMIFELALKKADLKPSQVWYCGDNPTYDVLGASASGIFPVWYQGALHGRPIRKVGCRCLEIKHWTELKDFICNLE